MRFIGLDGGRNVSVDIENVVVFRQDVRFVWWLMLRWDFWFFRCREIGSWILGDWYGCEYREDFITINDNIPLTRSDAHVWVLAVTF